MADDNLIRELLANSLSGGNPPKKRSLDLHYEKGNFKQSYPVPTYPEIMAKIKPKPKSFISVGDRQLIERQRAITAHYAQLDIQELNRQCLVERKARYIDGIDPFDPFE